MQAHRFKVLVAALVSAVSAVPAYAERLTCYQTQSSQILIHTATQTSGDFQLSGATRDVTDHLYKFDCHGTFLWSAEGKQYNYLCELADEAGDKFSLQNSDNYFGAAQIVRGSGTGKYAERAGAAPEYEQFPMNHDGSLPHCESSLSALRLP